MKPCRINVTREDEWYVLQAVDDEGVFTQARTLDEDVANIREVVELIHGEKAHVELVVPAGLEMRVARDRGNAR